MDSEPSNGTTTRPKGGTSGIQKVWQLLGHLQECEGRQDPPGKDKVQAEPETMQAAVTAAHETQKNQSQEVNHSAPDLQADADLSTSRENIRATSQKAIQESKPTLSIRSATDKRWAVFG